MGEDIVFVGREKMSDKKRKDVGRMTENHTLALIAGRPGPLRDSLVALLTTIPCIGYVSQADDMLSVMRMATETCLDVVLLDARLPGDRDWTALRKIKARSPRTQCIVLADSGQQQWEARAAGADAALLKGFPARRLVAIIESLLCSPGV